MLCHLLSPYKFHQAFLQTVRKRGTAVILVKGKANLLGVFAWCICLLYARYARISTWWLPTQVEIIKTNDKWEILGVRFDGTTYLPIRTRIATRSISAWRSRTLSNQKPSSIPFQNDHHKHPHPLFFCDFCETWNFFKKKKKKTNSSTRYELPESGALERYANHHNTYITNGRIIRVMNSQ